VGERRLWRLILLVEVTHMIGINFYMTLEGLHYGYIWYNIGRAALLLYLI
jgi:hypothetical protein